MSEERETSAENFCTHLKLKSDLADGLIATTTDVLNDHLQIDGNAMDVNDLANLVVGCHLSSMHWLINKILRQIDEKELSFENFSHKISWYMEKIIKDNLYVKIDNKLN